MTNPLRAFTAKYKNMPCVGVERRYGKPTSAYIETDDNWTIVDMSHLTDIAYDGNNPAESSATAQPARKHICFELDKRSMVTIESLLSRGFTFTKISMKDPANGDEVYTLVLPNSPGEK